jgi:hypothetical protein
MDAKRSEHSPVPVVVSSSRHRIAAPVSAVERKSKAESSEACPRGSANPLLALCRAMDRLLWQRVAQEDTRENDNE